MLSTQASAFNGISNIYAPQYRQATFAAISTNQHESSINSLELAYSDVKNAFEYFLLKLIKINHLFLHHTVKDHCILKDC